MEIRQSGKVRGNLISRGTVHAFLDLENSGAARENRKEITPKSRRQNSMCILHTREWADCVLHAIFGSEIERHFVKSLMLIN